jgi:uncharacterized protein (DUF302 family)
MLRQPIPALVGAMATMLCACAARPPVDPPGFYQAATTKPYADVLAELELAITERNFRITGHNKIGSVIREREHIAFPDYDTLQFCNLTYAREMLEISPAAVVYMPCNITLRSERGRVVVTTHLLPTDGHDPRLNAFAPRMNEQLRQIVDFAIEE